MISPSLNQELNLLGWRLADGTLTLLAYQSALAERLRRLFNCSSVSLWRVTGAPGRQTLRGLGRCRYACAGSPGGAMLSEAQLRKYFAVLCDRGVYACADTLTDDIVGMPGIWCQCAGAPRALLAALVAINGQALGVLSCYHDAGHRHWEANEEITLRRLGARVALHLTRLETPGLVPRLTDDARDVTK